MIYECHGHIILNGKSYSSAIERHKSGVDKDLVRENLQMNAKHGVYFYRDGGDKFGVSVFAKSIAADYGIDYITSAYIIHKKGYYGNMFGRAFESMTEYRSLVSEAISLGADFIKITASGLLAFSQGGPVTGLAMSYDELKEMIKISHGEGLSVMIHANGADNIMRAAEAGADSIEHGYYMNSSALRVMAQTGAVWVPTCVTSLNLIGSGVYDDNVMKRIVSEHKSAIIEASSLGVPIACGSDAGASFVPQGSGTLDEQALLNSVGVDYTPGNEKVREKFKRH